MKIIFQIKKIIFFLIFHKLLIKCHSFCPQYKDCFNCTMCGNEDNKFCECAWEKHGEDGRCVPDEFRLLSEWYIELLQCKNNTDQSFYCSGEDDIYSKNNLDSDNSITFQINNDKKGNYGKKMLFYYFNYIDETGNSYYIDVQLMNSEFNKPKVLYGCNLVKNSHAPIHTIDMQQFSCSSTYNIFLIALLKGEYTSSPFLFKITLKNEVAYKYITGLTLGITILLLIICIVFCIIRYYNKKAQNQLLLLTYQRARENMQRIEQEINNNELSKENSENIEETNKEKLDKLFSKTMSEHLYKNEYNQYGGGCSICLENFKKKSIVSITPCNHVFHFKCIKNWLYKNIKNPKCPNCNKDVLTFEEEPQTDDPQIIKVRKKYRTSRVLNNNLNFGNRNNHISITINQNNNHNDNNITNRGDNSYSQRQRMGE